MSHTNILHCHTATKFIEGLEFFVKNEEKMSIVTYNSTDKFFLPSIDSLQKDINNNYYFEYRPKREGDIMDNISIKPIDKNIIISYYIGGYEYEPKNVKEFIYVCAMFNVFKIRLTFLETPTENYKFFVCSRNYILKKGLRKYLYDKTLVTDSIIYSEGTCTKI